MGTFKMAAAVAGINFRRWFKDIRVRFVFLFLAYLIYYFLNSFTSYGILTGQKCSGWLLSMLFQSSSISVGTSKVLLYLGMLVLLCDAPFFSPIMPYMVIRSRRNSWWIGECLYIIGAALVYTIFITLMSMLVLSPVITLGNDWGGVIRDITFGREGMSRSDLILGYDFVIRPKTDVVRYLYPQGAQLYTFFAVWCSCSFLGLLMYLISMIKKNVLFGMGAAGVFIFLDPLLTWLSSGQYGSWIQILSPVCWTSIDQFQTVNRFYFMSMPLAFALYAVLIAVLCVLIWRSSSRVMIEFNRAE